MGIYLKAQPLVAGWLVSACLLVACGDDGGSGGAGQGGSGAAGGGTTSAGGAGGGETVCTPGEVEACEAYSGPEGTEGVGVCAASQRACLPDGSGFGACSDEVLPSLENCATEGDDDCDGAAPACTLSHVWSRGIAGPGQDEVMDLAVDGDGNVIVVGFSNGPVDLGGGEVGAAGEHRCYVAKYAPDGAHLWSRYFPGLGRARCWAGTVDGTGNVYVAGDLDGTIDFGGGQLSSIGFNVTDVIVAKLAPDGSHVWSRLYGGSSSNERAWAIAVDAQERPVLAGRFDGYGELGGAGFQSAGATDVFVLALNADGSRRWAQVYGGTGLDDAGVVTTSPEGDVLVGGRYSETVDFGGGSATSQGVTDAFLLKLDADGAFVASETFGGLYADWVADLTMGPDGDVYLAATVNPAFVGETSTIEFGGLTLNSFGHEDHLIARVDPTFTPRWANLYGGAEQDRPTALGLDASGNLSVAGFFRGSTSFGGPALTTPNDELDIVVAKYDPSGAHVVSRRFGAAGADGAHRLAIDPTGHVVIAGWYYEAPFTFGGPMLPWGGNTEGDSFLAKLTP